MQSTMLPTLLLFLPFAENPLNISLPFIRLIFVLPHLVSLPPSPSQLISLSRSHDWSRVSNLSKHLFLLFSQPLLLISLHTFHSWCVHSLFPSHFCPFLFKPVWGSSEGPKRRPRTGRKGCGHPHCSSLLC